MPPSETEPFVVIWSPKNRDDQPDLYDALKRLAEPESIKTIKAMATKHGIPGFEFQLSEIEEPNSDMDGKLGINVCFDQSSIPAGSNALWELIDEMKRLVNLPMALGVGDYHVSGERRHHHDLVHTRVHSLQKIADSRPAPIITVGS